MPSLKGESALWVLPAVAEVASTSGLMRFDHTVLVTSYRQRAVQLLQRAS